MNKKNILAVPLLAGSILLQTGMASAAPTPSRDEPSGRQEQMKEVSQPRGLPQSPTRLPSSTPPPPAQLPPSPPPQQESPDWMPMHYNMPAHYRMLEPEMIYGYQLMSPKERTSYMNRIHSAKTFEERDRLRLEHHRLMQERARKRRINLPDMPPPGPRR